MLVAAGALVTGACAARIFATVPSVTLGLAFIVAVTLVASEFGIRAGLWCAAGAIGSMTALTVTGLSAEPIETILARSAVLLFLVPLVGHATERAARSRRLLEQVLEATTDSIYVKDLDGRYLIANGATAQLIGRPGREIVGSTNDELLPEVAADIAVRDSEVLDGDTPTAYEIAGRFGERRYILSVTKSPFRDAGGKPIGSLGIARDITEQRRLREESTRFFDLSGDMLGTVDFEGASTASTASGPSAWAGAPTSCSGPRSSTSCRPRSTRHWRRLRSPSPMPRAAGG